MAEVIVGEVHDDGRLPRPWVFTTRRGKASVQHHRFHLREQAESERTMLIDRVQERGDDVAER